jgi:hypothetical protein
MECVMVICYAFKKKFIHRPSDNECRRIAQEFEEKWGFPQACGAIDGTHIPIIAPHEHRNDYHNRKGFYSIVCQAWVDHNYLFLDLVVGWPGRVHDARVLATSDIYELGNNNRLFPTDTKLISGVQVPFCLLGDPAYPLQTWLMKPYPENQYTTQNQRYFNYRLSRARMVVECAFGRLKGRWRCLLKRNDSHIANMPHIIMCCAILHNICETRGDIFLEQLRNNENDEVVHQNDNNVVENENRGEVLARAQVIRDAFCEYFSVNKL